jgi:hypothetical protein
MSIVPLIGLSILSGQMAWKDAFLLMYVCMKASPSVIFLSNPPFMSFPLSTHTAKPMTQVLLSISCSSTVLFPTVLAKIAFYFPPVSGVLAIPVSFFFVIFLALFFVPFTLSSVFSIRSKST